MNMGVRQISELISQLLRDVFRGDSPEILRFIPIDNGVTPLPGRIHRHIVKRQGQDIFPYFQASSYMAMMFSMGVIAWRLWQGARI